MFRVPRFLKKTTQPELRTAPMRRGALQRYPSGGRTLFEPLEARLLLSSYAATDYFPVSANNSWIYSGTTDVSMGGNSQSVDSTDIVTSSVTSSQGTTYTALTDTATIAGQGQSASASWYSYSPTSGVVSYNGPGAFAGNVNYSQPVEVIAPTMTDNQVLSWSNVGVSGSFSAAGIAFSITGTDSGTSTVLGTESVTTNNGWTFQALEIEIQHTMDYSGSVYGIGFSGTVSVDETLWLGRGVGTVKSDINIDLDLSIDYVGSLSLSIDQGSLLDNSSLQPTDPALNFLTDQTMVHNQTKTISLPATDADGNAVTYTAVSSAQGLEQQLDQATYWPQYNNARGWGEKYLTNSAGEFFYILPSGALYQWAGANSATGNIFEAGLDSGYYQNPSRLTRAYWSGWSEASEAAASSLQQTYGLTTYLSQYDNARGWNESYLLDASGNWYYILPSGDVYKWAGASSPTGNTKIGTVDTAFYDDPARLAYAWVVAAPDASAVSITGTPSDPSLSISPGSFAGQFPVYVTASAGGATTTMYFDVTSTNSAPTLNLSDFSMVYGQTQTETLGTDTDADSDSVTYTAAASSAQAEANDVQQQLTLTTYLPQYNGARGWGEKYLINASGQWFYILPSGALYQWAGASSSTGNTLIATLDVGYYQNPYRLVYANWTGWNATDEAAASTLEQTSGLTTYLPQFNNARGWGEKYMTDASGQWYYILSTGDVYQWNGSSSSTGNTLIGTLNTGFYANPAMLVYSWAVAAPDSSAVTPSTATTVTVDPGSFVGRFPVCITADDGVVTAAGPDVVTKYVWVTVTNDVSMLSGDSQTMTMGPATDNGGSPITYSAGLTSVQSAGQNIAQLLNLAPATATYVSQYNNIRGWGEKYLYQYASNTWYYILPDGALYRYTGSSSATGNTLIRQLDAGYYQDPSRLVCADWTGWNAFDEATASAYQQQYGLTTYVSQSDGARGWAEKYMLDASGHWYYILPTGDVYQWNGDNTSTGNTLIGTLNTAFYTNPTLLVHSWGFDTPDPSAVSVAGTQLTITGTGSYVGRFEVDVTGAADTNPCVWVTVVPDTLAGLSTIGMPAGQSHTLTLGPATNGNGDSITYTATVSSAQGEANDILQQLNLTTYWSQYNGARGWAEKYVTNASGLWFYILPTGALYQWAGSSSSTGNTFIATLDAGYYQDPHRLVYAKWTGWSEAAEAAAYTLRQGDPGQPTYWPQYTNLRGWGEKYFTDSQGRWYYILSTGAVYQWNGSSSSTGNTLVGTLDTAFYQDPSRLMYSWVVAAADPSVLSVSGNQLTVTPGSFVGQLLVCVTSTDSNDKQYVWVMVS